MKTKTITIKVSQYNEVNPKDLSKLFFYGARLKKPEENANVGVPVGLYDIISESGDKKYRTRVYSTVDIIINSVTLPCSKDGVYDKLIDIEVPDFGANDNYHLPIKMQYDKPTNEIWWELYNLGYSDVLLDKMTDTELQMANSYLRSFSSMDRYLYQMAKKYHIG